MASFPDFVNENDIGKAKFIGELIPPVAPFDQKSGRETWTVAFAPDGSYFAWSQGHRIVRLVPWKKCLASFAAQCLGLFSIQRHGIDHQSSSSHLTLWIESPLLSAQPCQPPIVHSVRKEDRSSGAGPRRLSRQNSEGSLQPGEPREHTIDCGDIVWGLAFGSSVPEKQSRCVNIEWHRFKFGQDQLLLATGLNNGRIKIWDVYTGKLLLNLMDHTDIVRDLTFAPDGSLVLVSASRDKTLRVWDLKDDGNMVKVLRGHQNWVYCSAFSPDSSVLCSVGAGKAVRGGRALCLSDFEGSAALTYRAAGADHAGHGCHRGPRWTLMCPCPRPRGFHAPAHKGFLPPPARCKPIVNSSELKLKGDTSGVFLWDMDKYTLIRKLEGHHNDVVSCEFSPDGALLATASYDTRVIVWDPHTATVLLELGHLFPPPSPIFAGGANDRWVRSVAFCHDGRHIASVTDDRASFWERSHASHMMSINHYEAPRLPSPRLLLILGGGISLSSRDGSVHFWASPRSIASLQHLCRMTLRRVMPTQQIYTLPIPFSMQDYLAYKTL
ncbi:WD repeat and SOCS box-containing protein 1 [Labeo rohita]|uniref:WD repeat and SOCS box-containing protein 1 n=1 Tax=Labeo rohita TaxID=84645 RepID=A0ABQ8M0C3_LABRO|nr:WD repeat and SOCS box-containing protein 1 [Labeo rohita]